jgi:hypothetical protein
MQGHLVIIAGHQVQPPMDAHIVAVAGTPVQPVNILRDQPGVRPVTVYSIALVRQPAMHIIRRYIAIAGKAAVIPQQKLARVRLIHLACGHFLRCIIDRTDGPVSILTAKGGDAALGADARRRSHIMLS